MERMVVPPVDDTSGSPAVKMPKTETEPGPEKYCTCVGNQQAPETLQPHWGAAVLTVAGVKVTRRVRAGSRR